MGARASVWEPVAARAGQCCGQEPLPASLYLRPASFTAACGSDRARHRRTTVHPPATAQTTAVDPASDATPQRVDASVATVRRQFARRAAGFARHDTLAREVNARMLERLALIRHPAQCILDLGCGAGRSRAALLERHASAQWLGVDLCEAMLAPAQERAPLRALLERIGRRFGAVAGSAAAGHGAAWRICADGAQLPLRDASVDFVYSNLMLHWHPAPHAVVAEMARVLRSGGLVLFSSYGPDTLAELREACRLALPLARPMPYVDMHDLGDMMVAAGFEAPVMEVERLQLTYADARQLLAEVRGLGGNPRADRAAGLPSGKQARALLAALRARADGQGRIAMGFEIVFGHGWRAVPRSPGIATVAMPRRRAPDPR